MAKPKKKLEKPTPVKTEPRTTALGLTSVKSIWEFSQRNWLYFATLAALVAIVYANSLPNGLVSDDTGLVGEGERILSFDFIFVDHGGPLGFLRYLLYAVVYALAGVNALLLRLTNIFFHLGNTFLLFILLVLVANKRVALLAASLFAVHPILIEAVTWISGGGYAQYAFFFMISLVFYILFSKSRRQNYYYIALVSFALALFSFNRAMTLAPLFLLYEFCFGNLRKNWQRVVPFFVLSGIWAAYYLFQVGGRAQEIVQSANVTPFVYNPLFQLPFAISSYFELLLWPDRLTFYHSNINIPQGEMVIRWIVLLFFIGLTIWSFFKNKLILFFSLFFIFGLFLYLIPVEIAWIVAERYVYIGSMGLFVILAIAINYFFKFKQAHKVIWVIFFLIVALFGVRTVVRNFDWKNEETLMRATLRTNPDNARVHTNLATELIKRQDFQNAKVAIDKALELDPELPDIYLALGQFYAGQKQPEEAVKAFSKILEQNPNNWSIYQQIANMYYDLQDYQKAAEYTQKTVQLNPHPALYTNLGVVYTQAGEVEKAKEAFTQALKLDPNNQFARQSLMQLNNTPTPTPTKSLIPTKKP